MKKIRIIPRLDVKGPNVVKGVHLEGLRVVGNPADLAKKYYEEGSDEIIYMDIVASLYQRNNLLDIVEKAAQEIFIPLTVGGGLKTLEDIEMVLRVGADKVALNTAALENPELIRHASQRFGSQCIVLSIEAIQINPNHWECFTNNGREKTGMSVLDWCKQAQDLGAGEILLTSVDSEGTRKGFDLELTKAVGDSLQIPLIVSGGAGNLDHLTNILNYAHCDALALASILHYNTHTLKEIKTYLANKNIDTRLHFDL